MKLKKLLLFLCIFALTILPLHVFAAGISDIDNTSVYVSGIEYTGVLYVIDGYIDNFGVSGNADADKIKLDVKCTYRNKNGQTMTRYAPTETYYNTDYAYFENVSSLYPPTGYDVISVKGTYTVYKDGSYKQSSITL